MTFVAIGNFVFWAPSPVKSILKIIVNDSIDIKMNIIQVGLYAFFLLILKKLKHFHKPLKVSRS